MCKKIGILVTALFHPLHTILYDVNYFLTKYKFLCSCDTSKYLPVYMESDNRDLWCVVRTKLGDIKKFVLSSGNSCMVLLEGEYGNFKSD